MFHIFQFIFRNSFLSSITLFLMQLETNVPKKKNNKKKTKNKKMEKSHWLKKLEVWKHNWQILAWNMAICI